MKYVVWILFITLTCCREQEPPEQKPDILALREMGDLATVEYTVTKIIKANDNRTWYKIGDRKILMSCEARIKAGVDLSAINRNNFAIDGKNVTLTLPPPKIISLNIPPENIKVEYEEVNIFRDPYKTGERDALAAQAEQQIRNSIDSLGILNQAKANTSLFVSKFLNQLGYENIRIVWDGSRFENNLE